MRVYIVMSVSEGYSQIAKAFVFYKDAKAYVDEQPEPCNDGYQTVYEIKTLEVE